MAMHLGFVRIANPPEIQPVGINLQIGSVIADLVSKSNNLWLSEEQRDRFTLRT